MQVRTPADTPTETNQQTTHNHRQTSTHAHPVKQANKKHSDKHTQPFCRPPCGWGGGERALKRLNYSSPPPLPTRQTQTSSRIFSSNSRSRFYPNSRSRFYPNTRQRKQTPVYTPHTRACKYRGPPTPSRFLKYRGHRKGRRPIKTTATLQGLRGERTWAKHKTGQNATHCSR